MNPEILLGGEFGKGALQRLLGQGTMGAVYLADQTQLQRQVAVKVFFPASGLEQSEHKEFLTRLEQEIVKGRSLTHPHILTILDHNVQGEIPYMVTPYIAGETLQSLLDRSGALPFSQIQRYLEQLATALDYAHGRGVLHRDIKAGNILIAPENQLLLCDFGLAGLTTEKNFAQLRRAVPGMLNYIAPEYVMGQNIDQRADLYALGVVLYQMVTGVTPFTGASLGEVAMQHVKAVPPAPGLLRADLTQAAEQVILRALAKRPSERYSQAQDLASAFRLALEAAQLLPDENQSANALAMLAELTSETAKIPRIPVSRGGSLFDPKWQAVAPASLTNEQAQLNTIPPTPVLPPVSEQANFAAGLQETTTITQLQQPDSIETNNAGWQQQTLTNQEPKRTGLLGYAKQANFSPTEEHNQNTFQPTNDHSLKVAEQAFNSTDELNFATFQKNQSPTGMLGNLATFQTGNDMSTGTIKLTEPVKLVQVPVAGQPGRFVTGFLPLSPGENPNSGQVAQDNKQGKSKRLKIVSACLALLVIIAGSGIFLATRHNTGTPAPQKAQTTSNLTANATARATSTLGANIILSDDLSQNIHNWQVGTHGSGVFAFKDGAYHITNHDQNFSASALLPDEIFHGTFAYTLTMEQISGDTSDPNNQFGMILDASVQNANGKQIDKFYAFEILNTSDGGQYQFWKYDNTDEQANPWTELWNKSLGKEFHQGTGSSHINTLKVVATGKAFTFIVNGKQVDTFKDSSFTSGKIGMLVNFKDSEVAFSHLLLTHS